MSQYYNNRELDITKDRKILMAEYLQHQIIVIADSSSVSRSRLKKCLIGLGAQATNIKSCSSYEEAEMEMNKANPRIVLSEYALGKRSGFDLLRQHRETHEDSRKNLFVLLTASGDQSLVAKAAEEDIDSFILKPYTIESLEQALIQTAMDKMYPSEYMRKIETGKFLLFAGEYEEAKNLFNQALLLAEEPTLAYFYIGQAEMMVDALEASQDKYEEGLSYNKIHYKCLVSLFDLLHEQEKYYDAYKVVRQLAKYFPANPQRLGSVLRLAIKTDNVTDIAEYYDLFKQIDERPDFLIKNMTAGLIICGKYNLSKNRSEEGISFFKQAAIISKGDAKFLLFIIEFLLYFGELTTIPLFLHRFSSEDRQQIQFKIAMVINESSFLPPLRIIHKIELLINDDIKNIGLYYILIQNLTRQERFSEALKYCIIVEDLWPEKNYFIDGIKNKFPQLIQDVS